MSSNDLQGKILISKIDSRLDERIELKSEWSLQKNRMAAAVA
ncbi:hypothetical protein [Caldicellulosiruptor changbaiensis]|nr:hypothetical protein [Caldicellulosiruptor changbaiensis]